MIVEPVETVTDYTGYDFEGLWSERSKVSEVERAILARSLADVDGRRLLEVGAGFGRLSGCLAAEGGELVSVDFDASALARIPSPDERRPGIVRVAANLYHLPFRDGSFTAASMIRVLHHLTDPIAAFREVARVLRDEGRLVVSYAPRPSLGTLVSDVRRALRPEENEPFRSATFSRRSTVELARTPFPVVVGSRSSFGRWARRAGFEVESEKVAGLEEYRILRTLPSGQFVRWADAFARAPGFPVRFARLRLHRSERIPFLRSSEIFACPRCRSPLSVSSGEGVLRCAECSFAVIRRGNVVDLRYVPPGVARFRVGKENSSVPE